MILAVIERVLLILGSLCLFLYGMKVMSDGIQQAAGARLQAVLRLMTGNRITAVFTGFAVTAIIQSSGATTVMVVSFVNAALLTLEQAIGVIMGANIGTTVTAWIVSLIGFSFDLSKLTLPIIALGFIMRSVKWRYQEFGSAVLGFGVLFMGLGLLTKSMPALTADNLAFLKGFHGASIFTEFMGVIVGLVVTMLLHSSSASTAIIITMAAGGYINFYFAASMVLGANIGSTIDAVLGAIGTRTNAKRAALVHVLFNVLGCVWAIILLKPLIDVVALITPDGTRANIAIRIAMFHTTFNLINTIIFLPFVTPFARLVSCIIKDKPEDKEQAHYRLPYVSSTLRDTPELSIVRAQKEIRDMAALVFRMYKELRNTLRNISKDTVDILLTELKAQEEYADEMREELTKFLMECLRAQLNRHSEHNVGLLLQIVADLEDMTDDCYSISMLFERSARKNQIFKQYEVEALSPYMALVEEFLAFVGDHLGGKLLPEQAEYAHKIEDDIDLSRNALRKLGRRRIEEGEDVRTELLFIDLVRRIERLGDYCNAISTALANML
jgi:phosphate:Na+ symporter